MMGALKEWLLSVTAAAILCALAQGLIPPGPVRRVGRLTAGLVMAAALLSPLASLKGVEPEEWLESWQPQGEVQELEEQRDETMKTIIEAECSAYIVDKAAALGAECQVEIECAPEGDGVFLPWQVTVTGDLTSGQREQLTQQIQEDLDVPPERQQYATKEESP